MKPKLWAKSIGDRGCRVRIYEPRVGANLMRSIWIDGKEDRKSLGHRERERAVREAHALLAALMANETAFEQETLTVGMLVAMYKQGPAHSDKKPRTRSEDARKLERLVAFLGATRRVDSLGESDVRRYVRARREGNRTLVGVRPGVSVNNRTIEADLVALLTALNWAAKERDRNGHRLIQENPLFGVGLPREQNPRRPVMTHDCYQALVQVAEQIDPMLRVVLVVAEGTGRRVSAIRMLRWDDVDLPEGKIRWRAENDKKGYEMVVPISDDVRAALQEWRRQRPAIGGACVFSAPATPEEPCSRHLLDDWLRRAYRAAGIESERGGLWHPIRRKWATERKDYSLKDVAAAGGWRDPQTLLRSYQQTDAETIRQVVLNPSRRLVAEG
jgi:integrase